VQNPEVAEPPWSEQMRRAAYVAEGLISCDKVYMLIDNYVYLITTSCQHNLRDVGVAGSNPVTPTIDFHRVFPTSISSLLRMGGRRSTSEERCVD
jgi:hypothetical protein